MTCNGKKVILWCNQEVEDFSDIDTYAAGARIYRT